MNEKTISSLPVFDGKVIKLRVDKILSDNGKTAERWFRKYHEGIAIPSLVLPSTSPANAAWSLERLCEAWREGLLN